MLPPNYFGELLERLGRPTWYDLAVVARAALAGCGRIWDFMELVHFFEAFGLNRIEAWNAGVQLQDERFVTTVAIRGNQYLMKFLEPSMSRGPTP